jgi:hypothetical protein
LALVAKAAQRHAALGRLAFADGDDGRPGPGQRLHLVGRALVLWPAAVLIALGFVYWAGFGRR